MSIIISDWNKALISGNPETLYSAFCSTVDVIAQGLKHHDKSTVSLTNQIYQTVLHSSASIENSDFAQTAFSSTQEMVEGLSLSVHGFFSYESEKSLPITSYEHQMNVIQTKMKTGDIDGAKKLFELTSSAVLHHKLLIDNFADMGLSSKIDQKIRNWASALGMLYRAQSQ